MTDYNMQTRIKIGFVRLTTVLMLSAAGAACMGGESRLSGTGRSGETCSEMNRACYRSCREHRGGLEEKRRPDVPYVRSTRLNQCESRCRDQSAACRKRDA